jgi:hypothetical protein
MLSKEDPYDVAICSRLILATGIGTHQLIPTFLLGQCFRPVLWWVMREYDSLREDIQAKVSRHMARCEGYLGA